MTAPAILTEETLGHLSLGRNLFRRPFDPQIKYSKLKLRKQAVKVLRPSNSMHLCRDAVASAARRARRAHPTHDRSIPPGLRFPFERCICLPPATHGRHLQPGNVELRLGQHAVLPLPRSDWGLFRLEEGLSRDMLCSSVERPMRKVPPR